MYIAAADELSAIVLGSNIPFHAYCEFNSPENTKRDVTKQVSWESAFQPVVEIDNTELAQGLEVGYRPDFHKLYQSRWITKPIGSAMPFDPRGKTSSLWRVIHGEYLFVGRQPRAKQSNGNPDTLVNSIARWDGAQWHALGTGLSSSDFSDRVGYGTAIASHHGKLIVSGVFDTVDSQAISSIATWDGTTWSSFGSLEKQVNALKSYHGYLYGTGNGAFFYDGVETGLRYWNGDDWVGVDYSSDNIAIDLAVSPDQSMLYVSSVRAVGLWSCGRLTNHGR